ncbi:hypothetical protein FEV09_05860 [Pseudanabaena catenata USMAC16]|uniref:Uncharacterized protein n=1 Tax=Pseudanabaena catenata USMAC16 TaxID=1855837 RepID=A0A9X4MDE2_9CYAN|nr:hypothetical protein [Pseudanabaena catenata]MDG3494079.1 hypothetical protein [Pseudanabaena catenata USMAC16]
MYIYFFGGKGVAIFSLEVLLQEGLDLAMVIEKLPKDLEFNEYAFSQLATTPNIEKVVDLAT